MIIGYGVYATRDFASGDFLLDYRGKLLDPAESDMLPDQTYVYFFQAGSKYYRLVLTLKIVVFMYCNLTECKLTVGCFHQ